MTEAPETLRIAATSQQDIGSGTARLNQATRERLQVHVGECILITGRRTTGAVVTQAPEDDPGDGLLRTEALVRRNAGASIGDRVTVRKVQPPAAESVTIAPVYSGTARLDPGVGLEQVASEALARRPFVEDDVFLLPGVFLEGAALPFVVTATTPAGIVQVTTRTRVHFLPELPR